MSQSTPAPVEELDPWNGARGARWVTQQVRLDRVLAPLDAQGLATAEPAVGERVIEIGCGCGASTLALADRVGPSGAVLGVDISAPMLAVARTRTRSRPWVALREGDAARVTFSGKDGQVDLLYSRLGVMFFDDPAAAFTNLRRALRPGGRLAFVCWRSAAENPRHTVPFEAARAAAGAAIAPDPPGAPGPFAFADSEHVLGILKQAGFRDAAVQPCDLQLELSAQGLEEAVAFALDAGPASRVLAGTSPAVAARVRAAVEGVLARRMSGQSVKMGAAVSLVRAQA
jgi:SAM-dependent methyltransferase